MKPLLLRSNSCHFIILGKRSIWIHEKKVLPLKLVIRLPPVLPRCRSGLCVFGCKCIRFPEYSYFKRSSVLLNNNFIDLLEKYIPQLYIEIYTNHFEVYVKRMKYVLNSSSVNHHHINPFESLFAFFASILTFTSCDRYIFCLLQKQGKVVEKLLKEIIKNTGGELDVKWKPNLNYIIHFFWIDQNILREDNIHEVQFKHTFKYI